MEVKENSEHNKISDLAWQNFCETGEIGYYMLHKRTENKQAVKKKCNDKKKKKCN